MAGGAPITSASFVSGGLPQPLKPAFLSALGMAHQICLTRRRASAVLPERMRLAHDSTPSNGGRNFVVLSGLDFMCPPGLKVW